MGNVGFLILGVLGVGNRNLRSKANPLPLSQFQFGSSEIKIKEKPRWLLMKGGMPVVVFPRQCFLLKYSVFYGAKPTKQRYQTFTIFSVFQRSFPHGTHVTDSNTHCSNQLRYSHHRSGDETGVVTNRDEQPEIFYNSHLDDFFFAHQIPLFVTTQVSSRLRWRTHPIKSP